jgi:enoyl-CoA hydratase/carnithine racemase
MALGMTTPDTHLRCTHEGGVRTLVLERPDKRNALTLPMLEGLLAQFTAAPEPADKVVVLRATGSVFCAGLDLRDLEQSRKGAALFERVLRAAVACPLPIVAVVQGDALAGGNELALHCDLVVASEAARFGMPLAGLGLAPSWFLTKKLLDALGPAVAREMLLLGDPLPAARLCELGVVTRTAPADALDGVASALVQRLAANAPLAVRAMKAAIVRLQTFRDGIDHEDIDRLIAQVAESDDYREGVRARLERRSPRWSGR